MGRHKGYVPAGVIPATLLAFNEDFSIDEAETRRHLTQVAGTRGISAITVNGHASEVHACNFEEQRRILALSAAAVGDRLPLVNGVYADGSLEAARIARIVNDEGHAESVGPAQPAYGDVGGVRIDDAAPLTRQSRARRLHQRIGGLGQQQQRPHGRHTSRTRILPRPGRPR